MPKISKLYQESIAKDRARLIGRLYEQLEADIHDHEVDAIHDLLWHIPEHAIFEYFEANREENDDDK